MPGLPRLRNSGAQGSFHEKLNRIYIHRSGLSSSSHIPWQSQLTFTYVWNLCTVRTLPASSHFLLISFLYILLMQTCPVYPYRYPGFLNMAFFKSLLTRQLLCVFLLPKFGFKLLNIVWNFFEVCGKCSLVQPMLCIASKYFLFKFDTWCVCINQNIIFLIAIIPFTEEKKNQCFFFYFPKADTYLNLIGFEYRHQSTLFTSEKIFLAFYLSKLHLLYLFVNKSRVESLWHFSLWPVF